jgi:hypothetical protein
VSDDAPTPRQVLYALVAGGFVVVVAILTIGSAAAGLVPTWWSGILALLIALSATWIAQSWRRTGSVLLVAIGLFVVWMVGTLALAT